MGIRIRIRTRILNTDFNCGSVTWIGFGSAKILDPDIDTDLTECPQKCFCKFCKSLLPLYVVFSAADLLLRFGSIFVHVTSEAGVLVIGSFVILTVNRDSSVGGSIGR
jgi:hypothetical protein